MGICLIAFSHLANATVKMVYIAAFKRYEALDIIVNNLRSTQKSSSPIQRPLHGAGAGEKGAPGRSGDDGRTVNVIQLLAQR